MFITKKLKTSHKNKEQSKSKLPNIKIMDNLSGSDSVDSPYEEYLDQSPAVLGELMHV